MILSVSQPFRCRAIYASNLLFIRKKSPVVPIHQNCLLHLSTLKKPADQPLHVSTSVKNLKFKCETAAMSTVMKKKYITGVYLATRWAVPNLAYQQLNALALTPYPTLSIMTLNLSPGKACYASRASIWGSLLTSIGSRSTIEVVNKSHIDIDKISIKQIIGNRTICEDLKAGEERVINVGEIKKCIKLKEVPEVTISAGLEEKEINPHAFVFNKKLVFYINEYGKWDWEGMS